MEAIGLIFFACLAFAVAILILITCCIFKVSGDKTPHDLEMAKSDTIDRIHKMGYKKTDDSKLSSHNQNVILFLHKKRNSSSDTTFPKQNLGSNNRNQRSNDVIDEGYQNGEGHQKYDGCQNDRDLLVDNQCSNRTHERTICYPNHLVSSNHGHEGSYHQDQDRDGIGHYNDGFSSHFSSSHHDGGLGHHSSVSGHHGHHHDSGNDHDGGDGDGGG